MLNSHLHCPFSKHILKDIYTLWLSTQYETHWITVVFILLYN